MEAAGEGRNICLRLLERKEIRAVIPSVWDSQLLKSLRVAGCVSERCPGTGWALTQNRLEDRKRYDQSGARGVSAGEQAGSGMNLVNFKT